MFSVELESERRMLWDDVLPRLRSRIQSLELDVQLVDTQHAAGAVLPADSHLDGRSLTCDSHKPVTVTLTPVLSNQ